jgi:hypothetical protein
VGATDVTDIVRDVWEARRGHPGFEPDREELELLLDKPGTRIGDALAFHLVRATRRPR